MTTDPLAEVRAIRVLTNGNDRRAAAAGAALFGDGRLDDLRVLPCGHLGDPGDLCCGGPR